MSIEEKYERLAKDTRTVLRAIKKALTSGEGKFDNGRDVFFVLYWAGELHLFKADQRLGSARLYQDEDFNRFMSVCLGYMEEGDV